MCWGARFLGGGQSRILKTPPAPGFLPARGGLCFAGIIKTPGTQPAGGYSLFFSNGNRIESRSLENSAFLGGGRS